MGMGGDSELPMAAPTSRYKLPPTLRTIHPLLFLRRRIRLRAFSTSVTPRFFAVSSYKGDKVWYDRCNFSRGLVHCVLINYPAREERAWDDIVTRISLSLSGK